MSSGRPWPLWGRGTRHRPMARDARGHCRDYATGAVMSDQGTKTIITYALLPMAGLSSPMEARDDAQMILLARFSLSATALLQGAQATSAPMDNLVLKRCAKLYPRLSSTANEHSR